MIQVICSVAMFLFLSMSTAAQSRPDSLKKYSYFIYGTFHKKNSTEASVIQGTCFFIRAGGKTYLVSTAQVMTSCRTDSAFKPIVYPDTLFVRIPANTNGKFEFYPVVIREPRKKGNCFYYYEQPDIYAIEFENADKRNLNTINLASDQLDNITLSAKAMTYGFPSLPKEPQDTFLLKDASVLEVSGLESTPIEDINQNNTIDRSTRLDSVNYIIKPTGPVAHGYSGAPVFLQNRGSNEWYFGGVVTQSNSNNQVFIVKPKFVYRLVDPKSQR